MKPHSIIAIAASLLFAVTGCVAQAGTEESSAEDLTTQGNVAEAPNTAGPAANARTRANVVEEKQQHVKGLNLENEENLELQNGPNNPGDPSQDPSGDPTEPDPHPWHASTATVSK